MIDRGDYVRDAAGNLAEGDEVFEEVAFLLSTLEGTFVAAPDRGNAVIRVQTYTDRSAIEVRDHVLRALDPAIRREVIADFIVTPSPHMHDDSTADLEYLVTYRKTGRVEP
jgi:hypothetical protein